MMRCKEIKEHPKLRNQTNLLDIASADDKFHQQRSTTTAKLHFTPRKKYSARGARKPQSSIGSDSEESKVPLTRLQKVEKLIEGELPKK